MPTTRQARSWIFLLKKLCASSVRFATLKNSRAAWKQIPCFFFSIWSEYGDIREDAHKCLYFVEIRKIRSGKEFTKCNEQLVPRSFLDCCTCIFSNFIFLFRILSPLVMTEYAWSHSEAVLYISLYLSGTGLLGMILMWSAVRLTKW